MKLNWLTSEMNPILYVNQYSIKTQKYAHLRKTWAASYTPQTASPLFFAEDITSTNAFLTAFLLYLEESRPIFSFHITENILLNFKPVLWKIRQTNIK